MSFLQTTAACLVLLTVTIDSSAAELLALHPENPRYFLWRDKPTLLVTSGEHYGALLNLDFDYAAYFEELASHSLNHTRVFAGTYREIPSSFGITDNTLAPKPNRYLAPWARSNQSGYFDGGNKYDLTKWNPDYFRRLHDLMKQAGERGVVVELTLFCPFYNDDLWRANPMNAANNINRIGSCPSKEVYTLKHDDLTRVQLDFVRKVVQELQDYDNLYYEICNEPYFGGVTDAWQRRVIDTIVQQRGSGTGRPHLISQNVANGSQQIKDPHPAVSIFNFHYCVPPTAVAENYDLNKVIGENETGFRGSADVLYRTEGWDFLLAGGGLYNNLDYSFTAAHPRGTLTDYKSPGGGSRALREQLGILRTFLEGFDLLEMAPDNKVVTGVQPELAARALSNPGQAYAIYLHVPLPQKPENLKEHLRKDIQATLIIDLPAGEYQVEWVNTKTGKVDQQETFQHRGGSRELRSPRFDDDIAVRMRSA